MLTNDELQKRIELLKVAGVRRYREGDLELDFSAGINDKPAPKTLPPGAILIDARKS